MNPMLLAIMGFVFVAYLVIGLAMPVLPLYVHDALGRSNFVVGLVAGSPFVAALLSRIAAGRFADGRGAKHAVVAGLLIASCGGVLYAVSLLIAQPDASIAMLIAGRVFVGAADSFIITGALSWGLVLLGAEKTGKVMAWVGTALYAAFAVGAPAGTALYTSGGFFAVAVATTLIPLCALALLVPLRAPVSAQRTQSAEIIRVAGAIWQPGIAVALSGVGFGAILAFIALLFSEHQWTPVWPAFSALSVAFIAGRMFFGGMPDRVGGANVAFVCVLIEVAGLLLIWRAPSQVVALTGVTLAGLGYSLVYPSLGVEAIRRAPPQSRGLAMGAYTAFLDLALGLASPLLGLIAIGTGLSTIYLVSALVALCAIAVILRLRTDKSSKR